MPSNPSDLRATGDAMQSALSRLATHIINDLTIPENHEVYMAALEARSAIDEWTELRRQDANSRYLDEQAVQQLMALGFREEYARELVAAARAIGARNVGTITGRWSCDPQEAAHDEG